MQDKKEKPLNLPKLEWSIKFPTFPPDGDLSDLDVLDQKIYSVATDRIKLDEKFGIFDKFFHPANFFFSLYISLNDIIENPLHEKKYGGSELFRGADPVLNYAHLLIARPLLVQLLEREIVKMRDVEKTKLVRDCISLLERPITSDDELIHNIMHHRHFVFEFIINFTKAQNFSIDQVLVHLINKRFEIKEYRAILKRQQEPFVISARQVLEQDAKRCDAEIERLNTWRLHLTKIQPVNDGDEDAAIPHQSLLSLAQIALLHIYQKNVISAINAQSIAEKYGYKSGDKLFRVYGRLIKRSTERTGEKTSRKNIEAVISLLQDNPVALKWAQSELDCIVK